MARRLDISQFGIARKMLDPIPATQRCRSIDTALELVVWAISAR